MKHIRKPAVAGKFYPASKAALQASVAGYLSSGHPSDAVPKALIVPHAGYQYSGPIAGAAYALLKKLRGRISRVLLIGPAHHLLVAGLVGPDSTAFSTPLGEVTIDVAAMESLLKLPQVSLNDAAHEPEHSLEVQLPFLQSVLGDFQVVPLLAGDAAAEDVAEVIDCFWDPPENLIVISSDLSHFRDYDDATRIDTATAAAIARLECDDLTGEQACGFRGIRGLLQVARRHGATARILDVRNSGDTAGSRDRVVGYGAFAVV